MNRDQAIALVSQLGPELGAQTGAYGMDESGEAHLVLDDRVGVMIKHEQGVLVLACTVATDFEANDPGVLAALMEYQYLGLRTYGCVLSWNSSADSILLSRILAGDPPVSTLARELSILLRAAEIVSEEIRPVLAGWFMPDEENEPEETPASMPIRV